MHEFMTADLYARIDPDRYPSMENLACQHCSAQKGHYEVVWTGMMEAHDDYSGWEAWFCCHACRDRREPCETFYPIRLLPGSKRWAQVHQSWLSGKVVAGKATLEECDALGQADAFLGEKRSPVIFDTGAGLRVFGV